MKTIIINGSLSEVSDEEYLNMGLGGVATTIEDNSWKIVTPAQARMALDKAGKLDEIEARVAGSSRAIKIWFEYATHWDRDHPAVKTLGQALGLTPKQIDDLFKEAKKL